MGVDYDGPFHLAAIMKTHPRGRGWRPSNQPPSSAPCKTHKREEGQ